MHIWLDDERKMPSNFTHHAKTSIEAITLLETGRAETISLDHDLGEPEETTGTGTDVARWIRWAAETNTIPPVRWMVHSANPVGRELMCRYLDQAMGFWARHKSENR